MLTGLIDTLIGLLPADLQDRAKTARKGLISAIGALLTALTLLSKVSFLVPPQYKRQLAVAITVLTAISTYLVPNEPASDDTHT